MTQFSSVGNLIFKNIIPGGRGKRALGTLFLIAALVAAAMLIVTVTTRAAAPSLVGGGPPAGQSSAPVEALIDINNASEAFKTSGVGAPNVTMGTANVELLECTGTSDATTCPGTTGANLCTAAPLTTGTGGASSRITCDHAALGVNKTYRFRVIGTDVDATNAVRSGDGAVDGASTGTRLVTTVTRLFRTSSFSGGTNTTPPAVVGGFPTPGSTGVPANVLMNAILPNGPEGDAKTSGDNSITNHVNITLQAITSGVPSGTDLCGATGCTLTWDAATRTLTINPTDLTSGTEYQLSIAGVQNAANIPLLPYIVRFTAGATDSTAPTLRTTGATVPATGATGVSRFVSGISAFLSDALDPTTVTTTTSGLYIDDGAGGGTTSGTRDGSESLLTASQIDIGYESRSKAVRFALLAPLTASTKYCFQFTNGVKDTAGNALTASSNQCFTTGSDSDNTPPTVSYCDADNFKTVCRFNEALTQSTLITSNQVNTSNVAMECPTGVPVNLTGKTAVWGPEVKEFEIQGLGLQNGQTCKVTFTGVTDIAGNAITANGTTNVGNFSVLSSATTGGFLGSGGATQDFASGTNFAVFAQHPSRCQPRSLATAKATSLECEFSVPVALATGSKFLITMPTGFTVTDAAAVADSASFMNADLNGPGPGITTITGVSADNGSATITVTIGHSGTAMGSSDHLRFELSGITNPSTAGEDLRTSIVIKDASGVKQGQTINASPFQMQAAGMLEIKGAVFKDSDSDGVKDAGEGIAAIKVYCNQMGGFTVGTTGGAMMGFQDVTTDANGDFTFSGLTSGQYGCNIPPQTALNNASVGGSSPFQNVTLASTSKSCVPATGRTDCVDFKFTDLGGAGARTLTVNITGGPASTALDVFCFSPSNFQSSAPTMKALTLDGAGAGSTTLKLLNNVNYDCGIGPHMAFETFGTGTAPPPPTFSFMPPRPQPVVGGTADAALTFALTATNRTITGSVVDGSSAGIANIFVHAEPKGCFDATSGEFKQCNGAFGQTKSDGTFTLNVADGVYEVGADGAGLPPSTRATASVKGANVTGITLKMVKSSTTISGTVSDESGNGIKWAHVSGQRITAGGTCSSFTPAGGFSDSPTDSSGNYTLYTAVGTWCVRAFAPSYGEIGSRVVVVTSGTSQTGQNIAATAAEYGTITGTVTSGGTAVTSGFFNCYGTSGGNNAQIGSDGTISMKVKAGTYTCDGFVPGVGPVTRQENKVVSANATTALGTIALGSAGTITVAVTGISDGFCDARNATTGIGSGAPLNSGTATLKVQAGTFTVRCGSPKTGELVNQSSVVVAAGGTATVAATSTLTTRSVAGQVTDGTNNLEGVTLKFDDKSTGRSFAVITGNESGSHVSPANNLSATVIPEGTYKVTASKKGYEAATTTATVSGGNLDLTAGSTFLALTKATGTGTTGATVNIPVDAADGTTDYTGAATVIATKNEAGVVKTVVGELDATAGTAPLDLTAGTWTLTAVGDNGKTVASSETIVIANGVVTTVNGVSTSDVSGADLDLTTNFGGKTDAQLVALLQTESETVALSSGGLLKFEDLSVATVAPEVNIPAGVLHPSDSSTGKVEMKADTTLAGIDPGTDLNFVGSSGYELTPKDASGNPITDITGTVTVTMPYTQADVTAAGVDESKLQFASFDTTSQSWETFPTTVDTTNNLLIASISHFSSFGIIGGVSTSQAAGSPSDLTPPGAPSSVRLTSNGTKVTLSWTDPTDSDFQKIEILRNDGNGSPVSGSVYATIAKGIQTFDDTGVMAGKTYKYILKSRDTALNQRVTDEFSITVAAAASGSVSAPAATTSGGGSVAATPAPSAAAPAAAAPAASAAPAAQPAAPAAPVARLIHDPSNLTTLLAGLNQVRKPSEEAKYMPLIKSDAIAFKVGLTAEQEATITNFVSYGHSTATVKLGAGERRAVLRDYLETVGRGNVNFDDVERMTKGEKPVARNLEKERAQVTVALKIFVKIYGHNPNFQNAEEDLAWNTLMYRIRFPRDLAKEKEGITEFRAVFGRTPRTTMDWAVVRVLGYVKY